ncbi:hypothetical protein JAAARDRAFT_201274 [Jaapia argillacea MUCL 33604]|uniref:Uncharacterized protein n=1 Tax=Jaapia argillacea MUCL 33604 TaxID=933084 RepID=A0A067PD82_9AGAM|nr:hypothetical protein JAAARDRAFT_201274 [Jaapia argillacea MUCL 33604]
MSYHTRIRQIADDLCRLVSVVAAALCARLATHLPTESMVRTPPSIGSHEHIKNSSLVVGAEGCITTFGSTHFPTTRMSAHGRDHSGRKGSFLRIETSDTPPPVARAASTLVVDAGVSQNDDRRKRPRGLGQSSESRLTFSNPSQSAINIHSTITSSLAFSGALPTPSPTASASTAPHPPLPLAMSTEPVHVHAALAALFEEYEFDEYGAPPIGTTPTDSADNTMGSPDAYWNALSSLGTIFQVDGYLWVFQDWDDENEMLRVSAPPIRTSNIIDSYEVI